MSEENVELTRQAYAAVSRRDLDAFLELMDPEVVANPRIITIEGGLLRGHDGIRTWWDGVFRAFPDFQLDVLAVDGERDIALAHVIARGHGEGSGAPFEDDIWVASRIRRGKVVWWQTCGSESEARDAAGLSA